MDHEGSDALETKDSFPLLSDEHLAEEAAAKRRSTCRWTSWVLYAIIFCLCITNAAVTWHLVRGWDRGDSPRYSGIESWPRKPREFQFYSNFSSDDLALSDASWDRYKVNGFVALPRPWAEDHGLPSAARGMPGDPEKGVYVLDGFHQLHCLMKVRKRFMQFAAGKRPDDKAVKHVHHCLDTLRQAITCRADDTPMYIPHDVHSTGVGQVFQCRDWGRLERWVKDRTVCYNGVSCEEQTLSEQ